MHPHVAAPAAADTVPSVEAAVQDAWPVMAGSQQLLAIGRQQFIPHQGTEHLAEQQQTQQQTQQHQQQHAPQQLQDVQQQQQWSQQHDHHNMQRLPLAAQQAADLNDETHQPQLAADADQNHRNHHHHQQQQQHHKLQGQQQEQQQRQQQQRGQQLQQQQEQQDQQPAKGQQQGQPNHHQQGQPDDQQQHCQPNQQQQHGQSHQQQQLQHGQQHQQQQQLQQGHPNEQQQQQGQQEQEHDDRQRQHQGRQQGQQWQQPPLCPQNVQQHEPDPEPLVEQPVTSISAAAAAMHSQVKYKGRRGLLDHLERHRVKGSSSFRNSYTGPLVGAARSEYAVVLVDPVVVGGRVGYQGTLVCSASIKDQPGLLQAVHQLCDTAVAGMHQQLRQQAPGAEVPIMPPAAPRQQRSTKQLNADALQGTPVKIVAHAVKDVVNYIKERLGPEAIKDIRWHDKEECTYLQRGQCSCSRTRKLIPMPVEHIPVQPSRTSMEAGMKLLEHWHQGVHFHKIQLQMQLDGDLASYQNLDEGFEPDESYEEFAMLVDASDFIQTAIRKADAAAVKPSRKGPDPERSGRVPGRTGSGGGTNQAGAGAVGGGGGDDGGGDDSDDMPNDWGRVAAAYTASAGAAAAAAAAVTGSNDSATRAAAAPPDAGTAHAAAAAGSSNGGGDRGLGLHADADAGGAAAGSAAGVGPAHARAELPPQHHRNSTKGARSRKQKSPVSPQILELQQRHGAEIEALAQSAVDLNDPNVFEKVPGLCTLVKGALPLTGTVQMQCVLADLQVLGLQLSSAVVMRYILQHVQELALDPTPALLQWQPSRGCLQPELKRALDMHQLAADVVERLLSLYQADAAIASPSAVRERCGSRLFLQALCAGGWEAGLVTRSMHLLVQVAECQAILTQQQQQRGISTEGGRMPPAVSVPLTDLQAFMEARYNSCSKGRLFGDDDVLLAYVLSEAQEFEVYFDKVAVLDDGGTTACFSFRPGQWQPLPGLPRAPTGPGGSPAAMSKDILEQELQRLQRSHRKSKLESLRKEVCEQWRTEESIWLNHFRNVMQQRYVLSTTQVLLQQQLQAALLQQQQSQSVSLLQQQQHWAAAAAAQQPQPPPHLQQFELETLLQQAACCQQHQAALPQQPHAAPELQQQQQPAQMVRQASLQFALSGQQQVLHMSSRQAQAPAQALQPHAQAAPVRQCEAASAASNSSTLQWGGAVLADTLGATTAASGTGACVHVSAATPVLTSSGPVDGQIPPSRAEVLGATLVPAAQGRTVGTEGRAKAGSLPLPTYPNMSQQCNKRECHARPASMHKAMQEVHKLHPGDRRSHALKVDAYPCSCIAVAGTALDLQGRPQNWLRCCQESSLLRGLVSGGNLGSRLATNSLHYWEGIAHMHILTERVAEVTR